ncbi:stearoyl-acyl-carrier desaturase [Medicago truncatula]|uniref:Stearoyl-acyl-carrier desaturase n=1 Tax=Medicago truncatula TaxID=3880 RepID=A0A072V164_MEDTR|nr:stearoyl-acyl-carrier desaturase [Medicago truncatula]
MARVAIESVDLVLANICNTIVAHEKRHEIAYERIVEKLREVDPTYTVAKMIIRVLDWTVRLEKPEGLTSEGKCAQELLYGLASNIRRLQERADELVKKMKSKLS